MWSGAPENASSPLALLTVSMECINLRSAKWYTRTCIQPHPTTEFYSLQKVGLISQYSRQPLSKVGNPADMASRQAVQHVSAGPLLRSEVCEGGRIYVRCALQSLARKGLWESPQHVACMLLRGHISIHPTQWWWWLSSRWRPTNGPYARGPLRSAPSSTSQHGPAAQRLPLRCEG